MGQERRGELENQDLAELERGASKTFDKILLNTGAREEVSDLSTSIEIDFDRNIISANRPQQVGGSPRCQNEVLLDDKTRKEIEALYEDTQLCVTVLRPEPDVLCTLVVLDNDYLKVFAGDDVQLDATLFGGLCGRSGPIDEMCGRGEEFLEYLKALRTEVTSACN